MLHTEFYIACFFAGRKPFLRWFACGKNHFNVGAGIVADSNPEAECRNPPDNGLVDHDMIRPVPIKRPT